MSFSASPDALPSVPLFRLGQIVATPAALDLLEQTRTDVIDLLVRHIKGDWGDVCFADAHSNDQAVSNGSRILSCHKIGTRQERLWIITEADRSLTTLLLPSEY